jgi:transposase-like protein
LYGQSRIFRYFKTSPEIIRLAVMMDVRYPLSLRNVEDMLHKRGIDITHEAVRFWWNRFGTIFAAEIRWRRVAAVLHVRPRKRVMLYFPRTQTPHRFAALHGSIHNHINSERTLVNRQTFKDGRTAALAEWRHLCAA